MTAEPKSFDSVGFASKLLGSAVIPILENKVTFERVKAPKMAILAIK